MQLFISFFVQNKIIYIVKIILNFKNTHDMLIVKERNGSSIDRLVGKSADEITILRQENLELRDKVNRMTGELRRIKIS
jgi:hypothetical protein